MLAVQHSTASQSLESLEIKYCIAAIAHVMLLQSKAADHPLVPADLRARLWDTMDTWIASISGRPGAVFMPLWSPINCTLLLAVSEVDGGKDAFWG